MEESFVKELRRTWQIDVLHHSHTDVGYTVRQELAARQHGEFLRSAVEILRREDAGELQGFRWQCENFWQVEQFLKVYQMAVDTIAATGLQPWGQLIADKCRVPKEVISEISVE